MKEGERTKAFAELLVPSSRLLWRLIALTFMASLMSAVQATSQPLELQLHLDPSTRRLDARAFVIPSKRHFTFELHESLTVTSASVAGKPLRVVKVGSDGVLRQWRIVLPRKTRRLRLEYGGTLPVLDTNLDHRGVLNRLPPMVSQKGSFLPAGSGWYPAPSPRFSFLVTISVPMEQRALVAGRLLSETIPSNAEGSAAGRYRASFEFPHPTGGIDLMAGPWVVRERMLSRVGLEPLRLRTYFFADLDAIPLLADGYLADTARYLERYAQEIGPYLFSEFSIVASPLPTGFGMPTLTYIGADVLKLPYIRTISLGHEVLHNWWGNGVYVDYTKGNWAEGLTTFMADYAYKEDLSSEAAQTSRLGWLRDFAALPAKDPQTLSAFNSRTHGAGAAIGYGKAAMVFFMLRDLIGEDAFRRGIRTFWQHNRTRLASWESLRRAFEAASGQRLDMFFAQWVERNGGPTVKISEITAEAAGNRTRLRLTIQQTSPPYRLLVPVELAWAERSEIRLLDIGATNVTHEQQILEVSGRPDSLRLDPSLRLWRVLDPEQLPPILRKWMIARAPQLVVATPSKDVNEATKILSSRFFETPPLVLTVDDFVLGHDSSEPTLIIGQHIDVDTLLARAGLPARPTNISSRGTAQVWIIRRETDAPPLAVISANDAAALHALLRLLPHYGSQSWIVFEGDRAIERGVWPVTVRPISVRY